MMGGARYLRKCGTLLRRGCRGHFAVL